MLEIKIAIEENENGICTKTSSVLDGSTGLYIAAVGAVISDFAKVFSDRSMPIAGDAIDALAKEGAKNAREQCKKLGIKVLNFDDLSMDEKLDLIYKLLKFREEQENKNDEEKDENGMD